MSRSRIWPLFVFGLVATTACHVRPTLFTGQGPYVKGVLVSVDVKDNDSCLQVDHPFAILKLGDPLTWSFKGMPPDYRIKIVFVPGPGIAQAGNVAVVEGPFPPSGTAQRGLYETDHNTPIQTLGSDRSGSWEYWVVLLHNSQVTCFLDPRIIVM